jgi:hypothetical protein
MYGNDIYSKRPFENQPFCYLCSESFSLKKQLEKLKEKKKKPDARPTGMRG